MDNQDEKSAKISIEKNNNKDYFLISMVKDVIKANSEHNNLPLLVTLNISGILVSGEIISYQVYMQLFREIIASEIKNNKKSESVISHCVELNEIDDKNDHDKSILDLNFIHLKNANYCGVGGDPIPNNPGFLWRGRISEVSGFSLGKFSRKNRLYYEEQKFINPNINV